MKRNYPKIIRNRKKRIEKRLEPKNWEDQPQPMFSASNIQYDMSAKTEAMNCGGIGAVHTLAQRLGLEREINEHLHLLKVHLPYHESDHVFNIAYNILTGGIRLEDIELKRQNETFLNGLGAQRIPDPTTAGDFTRRFEQADILELMECFNRVRQLVWQQQPTGFLNEAVIDVDGTIADTGAECKAGIDLSYKGIWGYAPLVVSLANTKEVLYLVNRPGNAPSHQGSVEWINRSIELVQPHSPKILLRGDTDFTHTAHLDGWDDQGVKFLFGIDAHASLVKRADMLQPKAWRPLERLPKYEILTEPRTKPPRIKEAIVRQKGFRNFKLMGEEVAEFDYSPSKCRQPYRVVVVRKNISVQEGEKVLFDKIRYFFYITNDRERTAEEIVGLANGRCDQENVIEQLKNGINAMRMPVDDLDSNWAYMVMATLAWNLKAWFALLVPDREKGLELLYMEFRGFLNAIMLLPCQIVRTGRRIIYRILGYNPWLEAFFATFERIRSLVFT